MVNTLWLKSGFLAIDSSGDAILCDHCPCGDIFPCCNLQYTGGSWQWDAGVIGPDLLTLYLTISGDLSACPCLGGTFPLTFNPDPAFGGYWISDLISCPGGSIYDGGEDIRWLLLCIGPGGGPASLYLNVRCQTATGPLSLAYTTLSCSPFHISGHFTGSFPFPDCCPNTDPVDFDWSIDP